MRQDFKDVYEGFLKKYGPQPQYVQCIEEMSELTKELCKLERFKGTDTECEVIESIKEEIADVLNMVEQLQYIFGADEIEIIRTKKIDKCRTLYLDF